MWKAFGLGKECKNPLELTDSQKILHEEDRKHMYIAGARKIQQSHEMRLKIHDNMSPKWTKLR